MPMYYRVRMDVRMPPFTTKEDFITLLCDQLVEGSCQEKIAISKNDYNDLKKIKRTLAIDGHGTVVFIKTDAQQTELLEFFSPVGIHSDGLAMPITLKYRDEEVAKSVKNDDELQEIIDNYLNLAAPDEEHGSDDQDELDRMSDEFVQVGASRGGEGGSSSYGDRQVDSSSFFSPAQSPRTVQGSARAFELS